MPRVRVVSMLLVVGVAESAIAQNLAQSFFRGAWTGQAAAVRSALASGSVDVNIATSDGTTALIAATSRSDEDVVDVLIEGGADVNLANDGGETALLLASMYGMNSIATKLIEADADVNARDALGRSPSTWAAWGDNDALTSLLKNSGADISGESDPFRDGTPVETFHTRPDFKKGKTPKISDDLRKSGVAGAITFRIVVEADGKVRSLELIEGLHEELDREVLEAAKKWEFEPGTIQDKPVAGFMTVEITYTAAGSRDGHIITRAFDLS